MTTQQTVTDLAVRVGLLVLGFLGVTDDDLSSAVQAALVAGVALVFAVMKWQNGKTHRRSDALSVQAAQVRVNQLAAERMTPDQIATTASPAALPDSLVNLDRILRDPGALARLATVLNDARSGTVATGPTVSTPARHDVEESTP